jgi:hypothetical protein
MHSDARSGGTAFGCIDDYGLEREYGMMVSAFVLLGAAVVASMLPAARAARVDVIQALRSE